jgi:pimeloyl-ACP methyl ester carboxylesterase
LSPKPFVLVHGSGCGGWAWDRVAPLLREAGHEVRAPDLEMREAGIGVDDHAEQVLDAVDGLDDVVLVGHSYAGLPVAVAADRAPEHLARVVYLDAFAPRDGDSAVTQRPDAVDWVLPRARDGLLPAISPEDIGVDEEDYDLVRARLTTTPLRCWTEPVRLTGAGERVPRTYVWCTRSGYGGVAASLRNDPSWDYRELDSRHMVMLTAPRELAGLLLELAR